MTVVKSDVVRKLREIDDVLVTSHVNPDGDAIGSVLAMVAMLRAMGKNATAVMADPVPQRYCFLAGTDEILSPDAARERGGFRSTVLLDAAEVDRMGEVAELLTEHMPLVLIDHHVRRGEDGDAFWVNTDASATAEMLISLFDDLGLTLDSDSANALYVGIMTDTGRFRFVNTTASALGAASRLVGSGASPAHCSREVYYREAPESKLALGRVLSRMTLFENGKIAVSYIAPEERGTDSEGFIDHLTAIDGVEIAAMLRPLDDGVFKVSLRSTGESNVERVARRLGGGGHEKAAGGTASGPVERAIEKVIDECSNELPGS
jgi:phosphoesterase RecJ-like protein